MSKQVLVVAAHGDDEVLGCGGTMARHVAEGDTVHVIIMTDGVTSRKDSADKSIIKNRELATIQACKLLGAEGPYFLGFPDNRMDSVTFLDIVQVLELHINKIQPSIIYTHHIGDLNIDHKVTHSAVLTSCRPQPNFFVKEIYAFEVLSSTEWQTPGVNTFVPNVFIDISGYIERKIEALKVYKDEMRTPPHSRSIENAVRLTSLRGNAVGCNAAEAFSLVRLLV